MAQLALSVGGAALGSYLGGPIGGAIGGSLGSIAGSLIDSLWMPGPKTQSGPRMGDLKVQLNSYGAPIPIVYGTIRVAGVVDVATNLIAKQIDSSVGGGLGLGTSAQGVAQYTYSASFAVKLCEGPVTGVLRIWADGKKIFDARPGARKAHKRGASIRIYKGSDTQLPDPWIEKFLGKDVTPAYRGSAYGVIDHIQLADFANHIPNVTAEVVSDASPTFPYASVDPGGGTYFNNDTAIDNDTGVIIKAGLTGEIVRVDTRTVSVLLGPVQVLNYRSGNILFGPDGFIYAPCAPAGVADGNYGHWSKIDPVGLQVVETIGSYAVFEPATHDGIGSTQILKNRGYPWILGVAKIGLPTFSSYGAVIVSTGQLEAAINPSGPAANHMRFVAKTEASGGPDPAFDDLEIDPDSIAQIVGNNGAPAFTFDLWGVQGDPSSHTCTLWRMLVTDNLLAGGGTMVGGANGTNPIVIQDTIDLTGAWSINGGCLLSYSPDEHSLLISRGTKLVKYNLDSRTVTGAELAIQGTSGSEMRQGPVNGTMMFASFGRYIDVVDVISWALLETVDLYNFHFGWTNTSQQQDSINGSLWIREGTLMVELFLDRLSGNSITLGSIVSDLCRRAGLSAGQIDVTQLTDVVRGYAVPRQMTLRDAIAPLAQAFFFQAVESDFKLKFVKLGGAPIAALTVDDVGAYQDNTTRPDPVVITDVNERELPRRVTVKYLNAGADYQDGTQAAQRHQALVGTVKEINLDLPIVLTDAEAKVIADKWLWKLWTNARKFEFTTSRKFLPLDAADVITLAKDGNTFAMGIGLVDYGADGTIKIQAVAEDPEVYVSPPVVGGVGGGGGGGGGVPGQTIGHTDAELMDIVLLRDNDDEKGFYLSMAPDTGVFSDWLGGVLLKSSDGGNSYSAFQTQTRAATVGRATTALSDAPGARWEPWDRVNAVTVRLFDIESALASAAELSVLNGANFALLGNEVIAFANATNNGDGTWTLDTLIRGLRGSNPYTGMHKQGDRFILLAALGFEEVIDGDFRLARYYKTQSIGDGAIPSTVAVFTDTGVRLMPLTAADPKIQADGSGNLVITWQRRTRIGGEDDWGDGVTTVPLGEDSESYEVDIYNGGNVVRTIKTTSTSAYYMVDQQVADFGSAQASVQATIYEMSATVGRGFGRSVGLASTGSSSIPPSGTPFVPPVGAGLAPFIVPIEWLDPSPIDPSMIIARVDFAINVTFPAGLGGSVGKLKVAATSTMVFDIQKNGVSFGSVTFAAGGTIASFSASAPASFASTDILELVAPAISDPTGIKPAITLSGTRAA
jgi:hypothetical protein